MRSPHSACSSSAMLRHGVYYKMFALIQRVVRKGAMWLRVCDAMCVLRRGMVQKEAMSGTEVGCGAERGGGGGEDSRVRLLDDLRPVQLPVARGQTKAVHRVPEDGAGHRGVQQRAEEVHGHRARDPQHPWRACDRMHVSRLEPAHGLANSRGCAVESSVRQVGLRIANTARCQKH
eukprot:1719822-Rhodomonas_salina.7